VLLNHPANTKVTNFYISIFVQKDIIEFDVSVQYRSAMTMSYSEDYLLENPSCLALFKPPSLLDELKEVSATSILHDHQEMLGRFEHLQESDDVGMSHLLQDLNLLKNLLLLVVIFHQSLINSLYSHNLATKLVNAEGYFAEGTFTDEFDKLIVINTCDGDFWARGISEVFDIGNELISFFSEFI
jgi:hypothetical protein